MENQLPNLNRCVASFKIVMTLHLHAQKMDINCASLLQQVTSICVALFKLIDKDLLYHRQCLHVSYIMVEFAWYCMEIIYQFKQMCCKF